jgi:protein involved in polysaccharide export with SLBB domain
MIGRKIISVFLAFLIFLPPTQGWGQPLEDQAQYYLQKIGPAQTPGPGQAPTRTSPPLTTQPPISPELPRQIAPTPRSAQILTTAPRQPEDISTIERRAWAQRMYVKQFGYSFFYQPPASFLPMETVPVGPDYIIGPGDRIKLIIWGSVQGEYNLTVDRNGQIDIPKVGAVHVSSLTYRQLREVLDREFARQYANFQMNVTLDNLRTIQVYVVGQARFPGSYAISSLSTLVSALFAAGGPSKSGSLRNIQVRRGNKVVTTFDMYDFLLRGDKGKDIRLQPEDVIFIPPIGPTAAIGSPKTVKELEEALRTLARLQLEGEQPLATAPESSWRSSPETNWRRREDLKILSGGELDPTRKQEGEQPLPQAGEQSAWQKREDQEILAGRRARPSRKGKELIPPDENVDRVFGMSLAEAGQKLAMSKGMDFSGPVKVPAIYELKNEKSLADLVRLAGGLGDTAFKGRVQVLRVKGHQEMVMFDEDLDKSLAKYQSLSLVDGDFVKIFPVPSLVEKKVTIAGAVKSPGEFGFRDSMRVSDLVNYAGGLLMQANKEEAEITRVRITQQGPETSRIYVKLFSALSGASAQNLLLQPNDYLFIRSVPDWGTYKTVQVFGEVKFPGTYTIKKGETLSSLLTRTGGFTSKAYLLGGVLTRLTTKQIQKQQLDAALNRIEAEAMALAGSKAAGGMDPEEAKRAEIYAKQQMALLSSLRKVEPLGRVIIRLDDPERLRGTPEDIELEDEDYLMVPETMQTVNVVGAVFNPTAIIFTPFRTVSEYVTMAGGTTKIADDKEIYVIKANGAAVSRKGFKLLGSSWDGTKYVYHPGGLKSLTLDPGDTIIVPEQLEQIAWLKQIKDVATIIGQIALTAGVALVGLRR